MPLKRVLLVIAGAIILTGALSAALPTGFSDTLVTSVGMPTALAFTPDGRLLITTQGGSVRVYQGGTLLATPALTFPPARICTDFERGLLGVAVDPSFATNNYIYLYYTFNRSGQCADNPVNRVSRFTLAPSNIINPASELVLVDNIEGPFGHHNGGDLHFGADGNLYISVGDGVCTLPDAVGCGGSNENARRLDILLGKILRVNKADGSAVATNPRYGDPGSRRCGNPAGVPPGTGPCQEMFVWGLRNPFRFGFRPGTNSFFINDVGQDLWEEINDATIGADYGWNCREGAHPNPSATTGCPAVSPVDPIFEYQHDVTVPGTGSIGCNAITGGAFVPNGIWPAAYDGAWMFSDYVCGSIFRLSQGPPYAAFDFATALGSSSAVAVIFGPFTTTQAMYYTTYAGGGQVRRITYATTGNPPTAVASASPRGGPLPLTVTLDATGSSDPDAGDTLTYFWTFGDGTPESSTTNLTIPHTYTSAGPFTATLRARDQTLNFSAPVSLTIWAGNNPPVPTITNPAAGAQFFVGQSVTLTGTATDPEDGTLPLSSLSWTVIRHHASHTHPFLGPVSGSPPPVITSPPPEDLLAATNSYLEIRLTATDLQGFPSTVSRNFQPRTVNITFNTVPAGLSVTVDGTPVTGPQTVVSWENWGLNVTAPTQAFMGTMYNFASWSDGGASSHQITTPASAATYTATFVAVTAVLSGQQLIDFDGDGLSDRVIFRPSTGRWFVARSDGGGQLSVHWGVSGDLPVPGNYGGDSRTDYAVFRPSNGTWYVLLAEGTIRPAFAYGAPGDIPVPGNYGGDSRTDFAVFRPSTGAWFILTAEGTQMPIQQWGVSTSTPTPGDFDGDGYTDIAVYHGGTWHVRYSSGGTFSVTYGLPSDLPRVADFSGDGRADFVLFRPSNGTWYVLRSNPLTGLPPVTWGLSSDLPLPANLAGDGRADYVVWRLSNGTWYTRTAEGSPTPTLPFGAAGDIPMAR